MLAVRKPGKASGTATVKKPRAFVLPDGRLGGNQVPAPHANLVDALGTRFVPPDMFVEDVRVDYKHNRLLVYRADLIHSASGYHGRALAEKRMTAVFFWMV